MMASIDIFLPVVGALVGVLIVTLVLLVQSKQIASVGFGVQGSKVIMPMNLKKSLFLTLAGGLFIVLAALTYFAVGAYIEAHRPPVEAPMVRITYSQLGAPPSLSGSQVEQVQVAGAVGAAPTVGVPKPVPDDQAVDEAAATQSELGAISAGAATTGELGTTGSTMVVDEAIPDRNAYVAMEKSPEVIRHAKPEYPEIAKRAGAEGKVYLQLLVDVDGRVMRVEIAKSSGNPVLDEAAVEAAKQVLFTPAIAPGGKAVRVWVMYPVTFSLKNQ
jgi:TonB family protein